MAALFHSPGGGYDRAGGAGRRYGQRAVPAGGDRGAGGRERPGGAGRREYAGTGRLPAGVGPAHRLYVWQQRAVPSGRQHLTGGGRADDLPAPAPAAGGDHRRVYRRGRYRVVRPGRADPGNAGRYPARPDGIPAG